MTLLHQLENQHITHIQVKLNKIGTPVIDLSNASSWELALDEFQALIQSNRDFWGNSLSCIIKVGNDLPYSNIHIHALNGFAQHNNIYIEDIQKPEVNNLDNGNISLANEWQIAPVQSTKALIYKVHDAEALNIKAKQDIVIIGNLNSQSSIITSGCIIVYGIANGVLHAGESIIAERDIQKVYIQVLKIGTALNANIGQYSPYSLLKPASQGLGLNLYPEILYIKNQQIWRSTTNC